MFTVVSWHNNATSTKAWTNKLYMYTLKQNDVIQKTDL